MLLSVISLLQLAAVNIWFLLRVSFLFEVSLFRLVGGARPVA